MLSDIKEHLHYLKPLGNLSGKTESKKRIEKYAGNIALVLSEYRYSVLSLKQSGILSPTIISLMNELSVEYYLLRTYLLLSFFYPSNENVVGIVLYQVSKLDATIKKVKDAFLKL